MNNELRELLHYEEIRHSQSKKIINTIHTLPISQEWKKIFSNLCTYRTWFVLNQAQQTQMINIADANSRSVKYLMNEHKRKAGLSKMEKISVEIPIELERKKAIDAILEKGAKEATKDIDLFISQHKEV